MNTKSLFFIGCMVSIALPSLACQPRGKCERKLRGGPNRSQQKKQTKWEILQAKKARSVTMQTPLAIGALLMSLPSASGLTRIVIYCNNIQDTINMNREEFNRIRSLANMYKDVIGEIQFPETPELHCPGLNAPNRYWTDDHADDWAYKGKTFLNEFQQKSEDLSRRLKEHGLPRDHSTSLEMAGCLLVALGVVYAVRSCYNHNRVAAPHNA